RGSLGYDLAAAIDVTLADNKVCKIPTGINGPIYDENSALGALLLSRSSAGLVGLIVLPGVIDADYTGEIMICAYALTPPLTVKKETRIAQLIIYWKYPIEMDIFQEAPICGIKGFGSTGNIANLVQKMNHRLITNISQQNMTRRLQVMMDTGANVTIID
ncbi:POK9 protein, partial [Certhia familiaris]|nr:POK9 protein [Certhia familiaris]